MRWPLLVVGSLLALCACSNDKGMGESRDVQRGDYGAEWPLTVDEALLTCDPTGQLLIQIGGGTYDLDPVPQDKVHPAFARVWADDPESADPTRMDLSPLRDAAQELCE